MAPNITVHYFCMPGTRADRVFWALEELGLKYSAKAYFGKSIPLALKGISPLGKSPIVEIDGKMQTETGAIINTLLTTYPSNPELESSPSAHSHFWSLFSEGSMMLHLQPSRVLSAGAGILSKRAGSEDERKGIEALNGWFQKSWVDKNVPQQLELAESFLQANRYFSGNDKLGEGDFMMSFPVSMLARGLRKGDYPIGPATLKWLDTIQARPAYKRALQRMQETETEAKAKL